MATGDTFTYATLNAGNLKKLNDMADKVGSGGSGSPFPGKPEGEPIVIVFTGQSNCTGQYTVPVDQMVNNPKVFDWREVNAAYPQIEFEWRVAEPNYASSFPYFYSFIGMPGFGLGVAVGDNLDEPRGNIGWACANQLQKETGRDVYMISCHQGAQPIQGWGPDTGGQPHLNGDKRILLEQQVPLALAAIGVSTVDVVIWSQGEANVLQDPSNDPANQCGAEEYAEKFKWFRESTEAIYTTRDYTRWIITGMSEVMREVTATQPYWGGHELIVETTNQYTTYIPVDEWLSNPDDRVHFTGAGLLEVGNRCSQTLLAGIVPKQIPYRPA